MANAANIFNNTILIPYHDSLVDSHQLTAYNIAEKLTEIQNVVPNKETHVSSFIKMKDGNSVRLIAVQEISGFGMERENEQQPGNSHDYVINLPGQVKYSDIKISHIFTRETFFLDWLTNGITQGGVSKADMEIHIYPLTQKELIFTLYDAFPVGWTLGKLDIANADTLLVEEVDLTYSQVTFKANSN